MFFENSKYLALKSNKFGVFKNGENSIAYFLDKKYMFERVIITSIACNTSLDTLKEFVSYIKDNYPKAVMIAKPHANLFIQEDPEFIDSYKVYSCPWGTYIKDITLTDKELLYSFKGNTRRDIQKGIENGLAIREVDAEDCYILLKEMFERHKQPAFTPSLELLKGLRNQLQDNLLMLGVYKEDILQSVVIVPYDEVAGYYLYGASVAKPERGAMHLLQYEVMKRLRERGVLSYDFYGARIGYDKSSKIAGIQRFKESFKPDLVQGYSFKVILRPLWYRLFVLSVKAYYLTKGTKYQGDPIDQYRVK